MHATEEVAEGEDADLMQQIYSAMEAQWRLVSEPTRPRWVSADAMHGGRTSYTSDEEGSGTSIRKPSTSPTSPSSAHYVVHREERLGRARRARSLTDLLGASSHHLELENLLTRPPRRASSPGTGTGAASCAPLLSLYGGSAPVLESQLPVIREAASRWKIPPHKPRIEISWPGPRGART